jgi:hypothetical protein
MQLWDTLLQLFVLLGQLLGQLLYLGLSYALVIAYIAWWLWAVNWQKMWPTLAKGAWVPVLLLLFMAALAWSRVFPSECNCLGIFPVANFWWQFGAVGLLAAVALFCGWLQGLFGWAPPEINLAPVVTVRHSHEDALDHGPEHRHVEEIAPGNAHAHH